MTLRLRDECVIVSVRSHISKTTLPNFIVIFCARVFLVAVDWSATRVALRCYILPVL